MHADRTQRRRTPSFRTAMMLAILGPAGFASAQQTVSKFAAAVQGTTLRVTADAKQPATWANTQLMIDADGDAKTGHRVGDYANGFEFMVEGATVHRFTGAKPADWSWQQAGTATRSVDGGKLAIDVELALLTGRSASAAVALRALSADYQTLLAAVPPAAALAVDLTAAANQPAGAAAEKAPPDKASPLSVRTTQDGADLVIHLTAAKAADLATVLVLIDTDANAATGFSPSADPGFGFEAIVQGANLSRHIGATRDAWAWAPPEAVKLTAEGATAEIRFNASLVNGVTPKLAAWQMTPDWQTRTDFAPKSSDGRAATLAVAIDPAKLRADPAAADVPLAAPRADANQPPRPRFAAAKNYACYYGPGNAGALSQLDAAILHIPAQTPEDVKRLNAIGVVTIGYISVGEDEKVRVGDGSGFDGKASWYFDKDGDNKPDMNGIWGSVYANAADPAWRADRVAEAKRLCAADGHGFQGIFLDTIETADAFPASRAGMITLVEELRAALPDKVIVMNRGFSLLKEKGVATNVDGLMYESFTMSYDFASRQYIRFLPQDLDATRAVMVSTVMPAMKAHGLRVLALDYTEPGQTDRIQEAFDRAVTFGMLPAVSSISLDKIYDTSKIVGRPDQKFMDVQATPESMQATLPTARNGFPAGTIVRPSSCFMGYTPATVVDGIADRTGMEWNKAAWASAEEENAAQQLELIFPEPVKGGTLEITFAFDNKTWHPSRDFSIDASADGTTWRTLKRASGQTENVYRCPLPGEPVRRLRVVQSPGGGSPGRPNLMWVQQLKRLP